MAGETSTSADPTRFGPGTALPEHVHHCHAIAYTISGEWEYEGLKLPAGAVAYEPPGSIHAPSSNPGAFFQMLDGLTREQLAALELPGLTA